MTPYVEGVLTGIYQSNEINGFALASVGNSTYDNKVLFNDLLFKTNFSNNTINKTIKTQTPANTNRLLLSRLIISKLKMVCNRIDKAMPIHKNTFLVLGLL